MAPAKKAAKKAAKKTTKKAAAPKATKRSGAADPEPVIEAIDEMFVITPLPASSMGGIACRQARNMPVTLTSSSRRHSSAVTSGGPPIFTRPTRSSPKVT